MLNDHTKELIHRALDDDLSATERAELGTLLAESEEARNFSQELEALGSLLNSVERLEPPQDLMNEISRQVQLPRPRRWFTGAAGWMQGRPVSYGIAAAAGLLAAVGYYEFTPGARDATDYGALVGTLARGNGVNGVIQLSFLDIDTPAVQGKVVLSGSNELKLLRFDVESQSPVEFEVGLGGSGFSLSGFAQESKNGTDNIEFSGGRFRLNNSGTQRFTVVLRDQADTGQASGGIVVSVHQGGEAVYQGVLSL